MEPWDILASGICHLNPDRVPVGAWLCDRCVGMYLGALLGVAHATLVGRRFASVLVQVLICAALIAPMFIDLVFLGWGSVLDTRAFRILTGLLGGGGWALFLALRGLPFVRWPVALDRAPWLGKKVWLIAWATSAVVSALWFAGLSLPLNVALFVGLVLLYFSGTAWAAGLLALGYRKVRRRSGPRPRIAAVWLLAIVAAVLLLIAVIPSQYKPGMGWFWSLLGVLGIL